MGEGSKRQKVCVGCLALVRSWDFLVSALGVAGKRRRTPSDQCPRMDPAALRRSMGEGKGESGLWRLSRVSWRETTGLGGGSEHGKVGWM